MHWQVGDRFDGRNFGLTSTDQIIGRAVVLCTDENNNGRLEWPADAVNVRNRSALALPPFSSPQYK